MKTIKFTDQELEGMIEMYKAEMEEAKLYISQIQELLKKLGAKPAKEVAVEKEPKQGKKRGRKPSVKPVEIKERKKPGRKPKALVPVVEATVKPTAKSVPVAASKANTKKMVELKPKKVEAKVKVAVVKKPIAKPTLTKAPETKVAEQVKAVVDSLLTAPTKMVKKVVKKKSPQQKRMEEMASSAKLTKPVIKKGPKAKPVAEPAPSEPIAPAEQL